jgi:hypothetical protein
MRRSAKANSITPPSELMRPPSNAAVIFLRPTDGSENLLSRDGSEAEHPRAIYP